MSEQPTDAALDPLLQDNDSPIGDTPLVNRRLVSGHLVLGVVFLVYALLAGFLYTLQLVGNYPFPHSELFSPGKVGLVFSNVLVYGALLNLYLGGLYYAVPALMKRRVFNARLGLALLLLWNLAVVMTIVGLHGGFAQALPWGETPNGLVALINGEPHLFFVDELLAVGIVLAMVQFFVPLAHRATSQPLPAAGWFISGGLVWFLLAHLLGSYGFELLPGAAGAIFSGLLIQGVIGLTLAALGWGLLHYFVPALLHKPLWSHSVAMLGFWGLAFFYPMTATVPYLNSTLPAFAQNSAVVFTVAVQIATVTLLVNFLATLRGATHPFDNLALRYFYTGLGLYGVAALVQVLHVQFRLHELAQFTAWMSGHQLLVLYGVFGLWGVGVLADLWPRLVNKRGWFSTEVNQWAYWLNLAGILAYFGAGLAGGAAQGGLWKGGAEWPFVQQTLDSFWQYQGVALALLVWANSLLLFNMVMTGLPQPAIRDILQTAEAD